MLLETSFLSIFCCNSLIFDSQHTFFAVSQKRMGVSKSTSVYSNINEDTAKMIVDTALGRMLASRIETSELSCAAITAASV